MLMTFGSNPIGESLRIANDVVVSALHKLTRLPRWSKRLVVAAIDLALLAISVWLAYFLRLGVWVPWGEGIRLVLVGAVLFMLPSFVLGGVYHAIFRFAGMGMMRTLVRAFVPYTAAMIALFMVYSIDGIPRTIALIQPILFFLMLALVRIFFRYLLLDLVGRSLFGGSVKNVLIYGAGRLGQQAAASLRGDFGMRVVGYIDDDRRLGGQKLDGCRVYWSQDLDRVVDREGVTDIVLALPNTSRRRRSEIIASLSHHLVKVSTLPPAGEIVGGSVAVTDIRPLDVEDLLGRQQVQPNDQLMARTIRGKNVLVTGAGGSIGSELCRQIVRNRPGKLVLCELSEPALYHIERELSRLITTGTFPPFPLVPVLCSVTDGEAICALIADEEIATIFHAAAYKHVPLVEANPLAAVRNNIIGTYTVARAALDCGASDMILVSTDKAVRPTNVMGATKRAAEQILQAMTGLRSTLQLSMVRFGNVLDSSGSVVPLFRDQILAGGPVTLTHRDIVRYFMTIPEAASLVIQAGGLAKGGEVFVLDMGEPVRIFELARTMIQLSGLSIRDAQHPDGDIEIVEVGLRPGEKLYEELLIGKDAQVSAHPQIMTAKEHHLPLEAVEDILERFAEVKSSVEVLALLHEMVPEFDHRRDELAVQTIAKASDCT